MFMPQLELACGGAQFQDKYFRVDIPVDLEATVQQSCDFCGAPQLNFEKCSASISPIAVAQTHSAKVVLTQMTFEGSYFLYRFPDKT